MGGQSLTLPNLIVESIRRRVLKALMSKWGELWCGESGGQGGNISAGLLSQILLRCVAPLNSE